MTESCDAAVVEFVRKQQLACEQLTEDQLADAIRQALVSGDFVRFVNRSGDAQSVVYIPFAEVLRLRSDIALLEEILKRHGIDAAETDDPNDG